MLVQYVAYAFCTLCAIGAVAGFTAVGWQICVKGAEMVQRTNVAAYTPNARAIPHNQRGN
jgi:hypothetical protein